MNKSKTILAILVSMAVTAGLVCLVLFTKGTSSAPKRPQSVSIPTVKTENATKKTLHDYVITNGEVESQSSIEVFPSMSGKIAAINVMLGSSVKKGDVIAKVDPSEPGTNYALSPVEAPISGSIVSSPLIFFSIGILSPVKIDSSIHKLFASKICISQSIISPFFNITISSIVK